MKFKEGDLFFFRDKKYNRWIIGNIVEIDIKFGRGIVWHVFYIEKTDRTKDAPENGVFHQFSTMYKKSKKLDSMPDEDELLALVL